jgi:hypothetical protein
MSSRVLVGVAVAVVAFGAAFAIGKLTQDDSSGVREAERIKPSFAAPRLPAAPPVTPLPPMPSDGVGIEG